jgi:protein-tyrosine phosphatase
MNFDERLAYALARGISRDDLPGRAPSFERRLALAGNYNFRDAGGYRVGDGRVMRRDVIFRSDHLADLTDNDVATVAALGLRRVHDFRLAGERERQPSRLPTGRDAAEIVLLGTADFSSLDESVMNVIRDILAGTRPLPEPDFWDGNYLDMVQASQRMLVGYLRGIAEPGALPALHHCTGGKDRTGVSTALLHRILGVSDDDIMDDFLLTNVYRTPYRVDDLREGFTARGISVIDALPILGVSRQPLHGVLAYWDEGGGARAYALDGGATEVELDQLSDALLTSAN